MTLAELQKALSSVEPAAVLVPARVLETMIRQARRNSGFLWQVPHRRSLIVDRQTLFRNIDQEGLALGPDQLLPQTVILIAWPESDELERTDKKTLLRKYWQRLYHSSIHLVLDNRRMEGKLTADGLRERIEALGPVAFEEIRNVLIQEDYLGPEPDEGTVFVEFVAVFSELNFFLPHLAPIYFPSLRDPDAVKKLLSTDVDVDGLFERTRLPGALAPVMRTLSGSEEAHEYYWKLIHDSDQAAQQGNVVRAAILRQRASRVAPPARAQTTRHAAVTELLGLLDRLRKPLVLNEKDTEEWRKHLPALLDKSDQGSHPEEAALLYDLQKVCLDYEREIYALDLVEWLQSGFKRPIQRPLPRQRLVRVTRTLRAATPRLALARLNDEDRNQFANLLQEAVQRSEDVIRKEFRPVLTSALQDVGLTPTNPLEATAFHKVVEEVIDRIIASGFITFSDLRDTLSRNSLKIPDLSDPQDFIVGDQLLRLDRRLGTLLDGVYRRSEIYMRWLEGFTALNFGTPLGRLLTKYVTIPLLGALLLLEFFSFGLYFLQGPGVIKKVGDLTMRAPDMATLQEFLTWKPGFTTKYEQRFGGFRQGELQVAKAGDPFGDLNSRNWTGPLGRVTLAAKSEATLDEYQGKDLLAFEQERDGFELAKTNVLFTGETRVWVFRKGDPRILEVAAREIPLDIPTEIYNPLWALLFLFLISLIYSAQVRRQCLAMLAAIGRPLRTAFIDGPVWLVKHTSFKEILESWLFQILYWYLIRPAAIAGLAWFLVPGEYRNSLVAGLLFLAAWSFSMTRAGQAIGETFLQATIRLVALLKAGLIPTLVRLVMDLFKQILHLGESLLFTVDEWLRFRGGDSRPAMIARAALSLLWFPVAYVIRFNIVVLIEPCLNPLKFPIVSIATKLMLPLLPLIQEMLSGFFSPVMGDFLGNALSVWLTFWLPDVSGFVFWEMKENWSLYRANRRPELRPVLLGEHGETVRTLLQVGFHSGTIPKLFARLRQAERKARSTGSFGSVRSCQAAMADVEKAVNLFVTREFCELIANTQTWHGPRPTVGAVSLATNQIRVVLRHASFQDVAITPITTSSVLRHASFKDTAMCLEFENRGGLIVAGVSEPGWFEHLPPAQQIVLHNALAVLFTLAGADRVREQPRVAVRAAEDSAALLVNYRNFGETPLTWQKCVSCWEAGSAQLLDQSSMWFFKPGKDPHKNGESKHDRAEP